MTPLAYHLAGGNVFFLGAILIAAGCAFSFFFRGGFLSVISRLAALLGIVAVIFSPTPLPGWLSFIWLLLVAVWLLVQNLKATSETKFTTICRSLALLLSLTVILSELPSHMKPSLPGGPYDKVVLLADSISSGLNPDEKTWPKIIREEYGVTLLDFSRAGATVRDAIRMADSIPKGDCLVILEIGGNDLLSRRHADDFRKDLDELLKKVCLSGRAVLMFELPLPPLFTEYGKVQRELSKGYAVCLIPKRHFAKLLSGEGNTVDNLHLSAQGHRQMADVVWEIIKKSVMASERP